LTGADVACDFQNQVRSAIEKQVGCRILIGEKLTRTRAAQLVCCFCGEIFSFALSRQQCRAMHSQPFEMTAHQGRLTHIHEREFASRMAIRRAYLQSARTMSGEGAICGTIEIESDLDWKLPLAVQGVVEPPGVPSTLMFHHFRALSRGTNRLSFEFPPLQRSRDQQGQLFRGIIPLFLQVGVYGEPESLEPGAMPSEPAPLGEWLDLRPLSHEVVTAEALRDDGSTGITGSSPSPHRFRSASDIAVVAIDCN
jgi:hypothetical protein